MKANELMVGDYIYVKRGYDNHLTLESIKGILQDEKEAYPIKITTGETISLEDIVPIPLTPEILEKNGFHKEWDEDIILMVCDTIIVEIGDKYKLYKDGKMYLRRVLAPLYYVHQIQHALRLCGIEKEIVL